MPSGCDSRQQKQEEIEIHIPPELLQSASDPFEIDADSSELSSTPPSPSSIKSARALVHSVSLFVNITIYNANFLIRYVLACPAASPPG